MRFTNEQFRTCLLLGVAGAGAMIAISEFQDRDATTDETSISENPTRPPVADTQQRSLQRLTQEQIRDVLELFVTNDSGTSGPETMPEEQNIKPLEIGDENIVLRYQTETGKTLFETCYSLYRLSDKDKETKDQLVEDCLANAESELPEEMHAYFTQEEIDFNEFVTNAINDINMGENQIDRQLWRVIKAFTGEIEGQDPDPEDKIKLFNMLHNIGVTPTEFRDVMINLANKYAGKKELRGPGGSQWSYFFQVVGLNIISEDACDDGDTCLEWGWDRFSTEY